ncbi:MAG: SGNH/GDSL hydrolase family protein [Lachnospiraceae bacterium]|nr:SGNH/GDSL hydrolase family protein [Lachnospiraceae bacterium]
MNNEENKNKKGLQAVIIALAAIGLLSIIALGIYGVVSIKESFDQRAYDSDHERYEESSDEIEEEKENAVAEAPKVKELVGAGKDIDRSDVKTITGEPATVAAPVNENGDLKITFLGDGVLDNFRGDNGIDDIVAQNLNATVYNLAVSDTSATPQLEKSIDNKSDDNICGLSIVKALVGEVPLDKLKDKAAGQIIGSHRDEILSSDIFVIEYGIVDFMTGKPKTFSDDPDSFYNYYGALKEMLRLITKNAPNAKIVVCQPSYIYFYRDNGEYVGDTYTLNNGPGSEYDYGDTAGCVAGEFNALFYKLESQGISAQNSGEMLTDGVYMNEKGRRVYADNLSGAITRNFIDPPQQSE